MNLKYLLSHINYKYGLKSVESISGDFFYDSINFYKYYKSVLFLLIICLYSYNGFNQSAIDSLKLMIQKKQISDTELFIKLSSHYLDIDSDSAFHYAHFVLNSDQYKISDKQKAELYFILGKAERKRENLYSAITYFDESLDILEEIGRQKPIAEVLINLGIVYEYLDEHPEALGNYQKAADIYDQTDDSLGIAKVLNNIGGIFYVWNEYNESLKYFHKSLKINQALNYEKGIAAALNNIGNVYFDLDDYDKAIHHFEKSLDLKQKLQDEKAISATLNNIGDVYYVMEDYDKALQYFKRSIEIEKRIGNLRGVAISLDNLAGLYLELEAFNKALETCRKSLEIAIEIDYSSQIISSKRRMSEIYELTNQPVKALKYYKEFTRLKDSLFNVEKYQQFTEIEKKFQSERQQQRILLLSKDKKIQNEQLKRQNIIIISLIFGAILLFSLAFLSFKRYQLKKSANELLLSRNREISRQKNEIEEQRDEIQSQRDLATRQWDQIKQQQEEIIDSINYASYIQDAILPPLNCLDGVFSDNFIFYKPKDIVSGDYYWMTQLDQKIVVAAADCTGHGVPGGFLSMLGVSYLNDIVNKKYSEGKENFSAGNILNSLRNQFIQSLNQAGRKFQTSDGMDISLVIYDRLAETLEYAGANNSIYYLKSHTDEGKEPVIQEVKADRMPIGIHVHSERSFSNHVLKLKKNDTLYLFTDGYADQFGGPYQKKFKPKKLRELFQNISQKSMNKQKSIIEQEFNHWIKDIPQIDDILIIGIRI